MTRYQSLALAILLCFAALPADKAILADMATLLMQALDTIPWPACYLLAAVVAKLRHESVWLVYGLMAVKLMLGGH